MIDLLDLVPLAPVFAQYLSSLLASASAATLDNKIINFGLTRLWLITRRGGMHDDPVVYAARDGVSRAVGLCCLLVVLGSTLKLPS